MRSGDVHMEKWFHGKISRDEVSVVHILFLLSLPIAALIVLRSEASIEFAAVSLTSFLSA